MQHNPIFIKTLAANIDGRDFIVGDIHGCFDELGKLLNYVKFNPNQDRVICTGDLVDRGPRPIDCLSLLNKKWFFSVLGNHEDLLITKLKLIKNDELKSLSKSDLEYLRPLVPFLNDITSLPLVYRIDHLLLGNFYVTHSEILPEHLQYFSSEEIGSYEYQRLLKTMKNFDFSTQIEEFYNKYEGLHIEPHLKQKLLWSRKLIGDFYKENKVKITKGDFSFLSEINKFDSQRKMFCGHNVVPYPMKIGQQYYIDTGCALGYSSKEVKSPLFSQFGHEFFALSMVDVTTGMCYACISSPNKRHDIVKLEKSLY